MIKSERDQKILSTLGERDIVSTRALYTLLPEVSQVTVRRDVARLAREGRLVRVRGGIKRIGHGEDSLDQTGELPPLPQDMNTSIKAELELPPDESVDDLQNVDVIILPPIEGTLAKTFHRRTQRTGTLCLDESAPGRDGVYLGVDNERAGYDVGCLAGHQFISQGKGLHCLVVGHDTLTNTRQRAFGFLKGIRETADDEVHALTVDAGGVYMEAFRQARDALEALPDIKVVFGINDHSIQAAIDAARSLQRTDIAAYCVGGEGQPLFDEFARHEMLKGFAAMFPAVVARHAMNAIRRYYSHKHESDAVITPHRVITWENAADYYLTGDEQWKLRPAIIEELAPLDPSEGSATSHSLLFILHYPSHHWYVALSEEFRRYCEELQYDYHTGSVRSHVLDELRYTRRQIAKRATTLVKPGDTIVINNGNASRQTAIALRGHRDITVITNSLGVIDILAESAGIKLMLTGGEFRNDSKDLVGPNISAICRDRRVDTAFLSVDGVSADFGVSCNDERDAESVAIFARLCRRSVVLADHSIIGQDATFRATALEEIDEIVTDPGVPPQQRLDYQARGVGLILAEDAGAVSDGLGARSPDERPE